MVDKLLHARKALQPFAAILEGNLAEIGGGGTLIRPGITVQMVKDAHAALVLIDQPHPQLRTTDTMKHAIAELEIALHTAETNEPIYRAEGDTEQADLAAARIAEFQDVISLLKAFDHLKDRGWFTPKPEPGDDGPSLDYLKSCGTARTTAEIVQPTTIRGWLETLPDGYRERALANASPESLDRASRSIEGSLSGAFVWANSPERHNFWSLVVSGKLPPLPEPA